MSQILPHTLDSVLLVWSWKCFSSPQKWDSFPCQKDDYWWEDRRLTITTFIKMEIQLTSLDADNGASKISIVGYRAEWVYNPKLQVRISQWPFKHILNETSFLFHSGDVKPNSNTFFITQTTLVTKFFQLLQDNKMLCNNWQITAQVFVVLCN